MVRLEGWEMRISQYIKENENTPFEWGKNDCVLFIAKAVELITGLDYYSQFKYSTKEEAEKIIEENNGIQGLLTKYLGQPHNNYMLAGRGDIVLMRLPEITCGLVDDSGQRIVALSEKGIVRLPLNKAWRIFR